MISKSIFGPLEGGIILDFRDKYLFPEKFPIRRATVTLVLLCSTNQCYSLFFHV